MSGKSATPAAELVTDTGRSIVSGAISVLAIETVSLSDALGPVAAEDMIAEKDLAPYARSAMDGYALRAADSAFASPQSPVCLPVTGKVCVKQYTKLT